jgi:hypothetical protein
MNVCKFFLLFVYICVGVQDLTIIVKESWDPINWFNAVTFLCLSWAQDLDLLQIVFGMNDLRWEGIVCFVDMGGIVDHYCLNFFS